MSESKNTMSRVIGRLDIVEEKNGEIEDIATIQNETQREKKN